MMSKMPWAATPSHLPEGQQQQQQQPHADAAAGDEEQSLTTILTTPEDRTKLLLLVAQCTESMRRRVVDTFDPEKTNLRLPKLPPRPTDSDDAVEQTPEELQAEEEDRQEQERAEHARRVAELARPEVQALSKAALEYFDEWRDRVIGRVGEALNKTDGDASAKQRQEAKVKTQAQADVASTDAQGVVPKRVDTVEQTLVDVVGEDAESQLHQNAVRSLAELYPPSETSLVDLPRAKRALILHSLLLLLLSLERYPAESRLLLLQCTTSLGLPLSALTQDERRVAQGLLESAQRQLSADAETRRAQDSSSTARKWKVGLGAVAGAAIIGITGGLAAPLLAAGVGTVMGGLGLGTTAAAAYLGAMAGSAPLVGVLFGAYGGSMTGKVVDQYAREVEDFAFLPTRDHRASGAGGSIFHRPPKAGDDGERRRLRVAIGVSGWLAVQDDIVKPWHAISAEATEPFALRWELEALMNLGNALTTYITSAAWGFAKKEIISRTIFGALSAGLWPLGLVKVSRVVDNPFSVAKARADKAGRVLAEALINRVQGERPVTLVGYSLGARLIYTCLQTLAERRAFGLVEGAVLLGAPTPSDAADWRRLRSAVSGRVVNVYSTRDYLLGFLYRTSSLQYGIAGLQEVAGVPGVENVDVSELVDGHTRYRLLAGPILKQIGIEDVDLEEAERQAQQERVEEAEEEAEQERKKREQGGGGGGGGGDAQDGEVDQIEEEVDRKNRDGMLGWMSQRMSSLTVHGGGGGGGGSGHPAGEKQPGSGAKPPTYEGT